MSLRLLFLMALTPVGVILTLITPFVGAVILILIYFIRPEVWGMPSALSPSLVITGAMLLTVILGKTRFRLPTGSLWPMLLLGCMVNSSFSALISPAASFQQTSDFAKLAVMWLLIVLVADSPRRLYLLLWSTVGGVLWLIKSAIYFYVTTGAPRVERVGGQGSGANYMSAMLLLTLPHLLFEAFESRSKFKWLARALVPLWLWVFMLTGSRGGLVGFVVLVLLYLLQSSRKGTATILTVVLAGFLLFAGSEVYWSRMRSITSYEEDESARSRLEVWRGALDLARKYPLTGIGLQNFVLVSPMYTTSRAKTTGEGLEAHNTYLQVLAEGGFPTLIVFFCMLLGAFRKLNRVGRDPPSSGDQAEPSLWQIRSAVLTGLGAFLGQSFFDSNFHKDPLWWFLAFAEALAWVAARQPSAEARGTAPAALAVQRAGTRT